MFHALCSPKRAGFFLSSAEELLSSVIFAGHIVSRKRFPSLATQNEDRVDQPVTEPEFWLLEVSGFRP